MARTLFRCFQSVTNNQIKKRYLQAQCYITIIDLSTVPTNLKQC